MSITSRVEVIYCDDIRQEIGGKLSYMGIYIGDMVLSEMPAVLPKLCVAVTVVTPTDRPFEKIEVRVEQDGSTITTSGAIVPGALPEEVAIDGDVQRFYALNLMFALSPFQVEKPSKLRVIATIDEEEVKGRALKIMAALPTAPQL